MFVNEFPPCQRIVGCRVWLASRARPRKGSDCRREDTAGDPKVEKDDVDLLKSEPSGRYSRSASAAGKSHGSQVNEKGEVEEIEIDPRPGEIKIFDGEFHESFAVH